MTVSDVMSELDERIDELAIDIERAIQENEELLEELPEFGYGYHIRTTGTVRVEEML